MSSKNNRFMIIEIPTRTIIKYRIFDTWINSFESNILYDAKDDAESDINAINYMCDIMCNNE
jgi:hypothetical protein